MFWKQNKYKTKKRDENKNDNFGHVHRTYTNKLSSSPHLWQKSDDYAPLSNRTQASRGQRGTRQPTTQTATSCVTGMKRFTVEYANMLCTHTHARRGRGAARSRGGGVEGRRGRGAAHPGTHMATPRSPRTSSQSPAVPYRLFSFWRCKTIVSSNYV